MAIKAYDRMRVDNLKPNLREFVQYFSDTVSIYIIVLIKKIDYAMQLELFKEVQAQEIIA